MRDTLNSLEHARHDEHKGFSLRPAQRGAFDSLVAFVFRLLTPENLWAILLFLLVIALIIFTTDSSPVWIYQGF